MGTAVAETQQELELTKQALERNVGRLEERIRQELDWRARLRRDLPQVIAIGVGVIAIGAGVVVLRRRFGRRRDGYAVDDFSRMDLKDVAAEMRAMRRELEKQRSAGGPLVKLAGTALSAAAAPLGQAAASRLSGEDEHARAGAR